MLPIWKWLSDNNKISSYNEPFPIYLFIGCMSDNNVCQITLQYAEKKKDLLPAFSRAVASVPGRTNG